MFEGLYDPTHRMQLNWKHAMAEANLMGHFYQSILVYNVQYGPNNSANWFHQVVSHGQDQAAAMTVEDPFLHRVYPNCLLDEGMQHVSGIHTKAMKRSYIDKKFQHQRGVEVKGGKVNPWK
jgi:hypothetical protein